MMRKHRAVPKAPLAAALALSLAFATAAAARWQSIGPEGGEVNAVVFDPTAPGTVYAATTYGGVFRSTDGGASWVKVWNGLPFVGAFTLAADGPGHASLLATTSGGLVKSADGGATWSAAGAGLPDGGAGVYRLEVAPAAQNVLPFLRQVVYVLLREVVDGAEVSKVFSSGDAGTSWQEADSGLLGGPTVNVLAADPQSPGHLIAAGLYGVVWNSDDGGASWRVIGNASEAGHSGESSVLALVFAPAGAGSGGKQIMYATVADYHAERIKMSSDGGETWLASGFPPEMLRVLPDPSAAGTLFGLGLGGLLKSTDSGASWQEFTVVPDALVTGLAFDPGRLGALMATFTAYGERAGIARSSDGGVSWSLSDHGLRATVLWAVTADPRRPGTLYAAPVDGGLYKSRDGGVTWRLVQDGVFGKLLLDPRRPRTLYAWRGGHFSRSDDGGFHWLVIEQGLPSQGNLVTYAFDPTGATLWALTRLGLFKSLDAGDSWTLVNPLWSAAWSLAFDAVGTLYVVLQQPSNIPAPRILLLRSGDGGLTFSAAAGRGLPDQGVLSGLAIDPAGPTLYLGSDQGVLRSTDGGESWTLGQLPRSGRDPDHPTQVASVLADPGSPGTIYAGTAWLSSFGVHRSTDGGSTWAPLGRPLEVWVNGLALDPFSPGAVFAATGSGLLRYQP